MADNLLEKWVEEDFGLSSSTFRWSKSETHSSLVVDKERNLFYWNSQDIKGGPLDYLMRIRGMSFKDATAFLKQFGGGDTIGYTVKEFGREDIIVYPKLVNVFWENGKNNREYWYNRTITDETINRFQLGYNNDWYTIPVFMDNALRNIQLRRDLPNKQIKYWYRGTGPILFADDQLKYTTEVFLTEGPTDAIILAQHGIPAVSQTGGSENWLTEWFPYFISQKSIHIVYDNDDAGNKGARTVAKKLGIYRCRIYTFNGLDKGYDPVDFFRDGGTKEQFVNLINEREKYTFELGEDSDERPKRLWRK
jgi:DNA primase